MRFSATGGWQREWPWYPSVSSSSVLAGPEAERDNSLLIGANPYISGPVEGGIVPAGKALVAPIEIATGRLAYFVGKPYP